MYQANIDSLQWTHHSLLESSFLTSNHLSRYIHIGYVVNILQYKGITYSHINTHLHYIFPSMNEGAGKG